MLNHEILLLPGTGPKRNQLKWQKSQFLTFLLDFQFPGLFRNKLRWCIAINDIEWPRSSAQHVSFFGCTWHAGCPLAF
jgi:hypothetical protein